MTLISMKMKLHAELIFIWKVLQIDSFWNRGKIELGNGLLRETFFHSSNSLPGFIRKSPGNKSFPLPLSQEGSHQHGYFNSHQSHFDKALLRDSFWNRSRQYTNRKWPNATISTRPITLITPRYAEIESSITQLPRYLVVLLSPKKGK